MAMKTTTLEVRDMACGHCAKTVEGALRAVDGVQSVEVSLDRKAATVTCDDDVVLDTLVQAVREAGYTAVG